MKRKKRGYRDPELTAALQQREYRIESQLNRMRFGAIALFSFMDIFTILYMDLHLPRRYWFSILGIMVVFVAYFIFIGIVTRRTTYHGWLKYLISTVDFVLLIAGASSVRGMELLERISPGVNISVYVVLISMLLIFICSLRYGRMIIIHNTFLGTGIASWFIYGSTGNLPVTLYAAAFLVVGGFLTTVVSRGMTRLYLTGRKRERLMRFLSREIIESIDSGEVKLELGGEEREVTVLIADIRGFTRLSEKKNPAEIVDILNTYFTEMTGVIHDHGGVIDKFIGDAVMAVFGIPHERDDDPYRAVEGALAMQERLSKVNDTLRERGHEELSIGIALHTGMVVAGNIGSESRMDYTVIGDTVNVASRIEGLNKEYGTSILFSESTNEGLKGGIPTVPVDEIVLRGRSDTTRIYTVSGKQRS